MLPRVYSLFVSVISVLPAITLCFVRYTLPVWRINLFSQKRMYALTLAIQLRLTQECATYSRFIHSCDKSTKIQLSTIIGLFENGLDNITAP